MKDIISLPKKKARIEVAKIKTKQKFLGKKRYRNGLVFLAVGVFLFITFLSIKHKYFLRPEETTGLLEAGLQDLNQGDFDQATENFEQAVEADQNDPEALDKLALSQYNQKKYDQALVNLEKSLAINPENYLAYNNKANIYRDQKEFSKAEENYRKAIELNPNYDVAYSNLAIMFLDEGKREEAKEVIAAGLRALPNDENLKNVQVILGG